MKLFADGSVNVNSGAADIGTGTKTVMAQVVAEELGVPLERIQIEHADTGTTQYSGPSGGSKTVPSDMPAARAAAIEVRTKLLAGAAEEMKVPASELKLDGARGRLDEGPVEEARASRPSRRSRGSRSSSASGRAARTSRGRSSRRSRRTSPRSR